MFSIVKYLSCRKGRYFFLNIETFNVSILKNARLFDTYQHKFLIFRIVKLIMRESGVFLLSILFLPSRLFENLSLDVIGCALFYFSLVIA